MGLSIVDTLTRVNDVCVCVCPVEGGVCALLPAAGHGHGLLLSGPRDTDAAGRAQRRRRSERGGGSER